MPKESDTFIPVYKRLFRRLEEDILAFRLKPGERIDSITQLQQRYRIGRETAKRVLKLLEEAGYIVQQQGKGSFVRDRGPLQKIWGLVFPFYSLQYEDLLLEVSARAAKQKRDFRHFCNYNSYEEELRLVGRMLQERYEAIIVIPTLDESRTWQKFYSRLPKTDSRIILLDHTMTSNEFRFVVQSYDLGVTRALLYLLEQGKGGVAFVENEVWAGRNMVLELMRGTYLNLMRQHRPDFEPYILPRASMVDAETLRRRNIDGVLCCDDVSAIHVLGRLKEQEMQTPDEVHVVGYGNTHISRFFTPPLTSVDPCNAEMADVLASFLLPDSVEKNTLHQQYVAQPRLIVRGT